MAAVSYPKCVRFRRVQSAALWVIAAQIRSVSAGLTVYVCDGSEDCGCSHSGCEIGCGGIHWSKKYWHYFDNLLEEGENKTIWICYDLLLLIIPAFICQSAPPLTNSFTNCVRPPLISSISGSVRQSIIVLVIYFSLPSPPSLNSSYNLQPTTGSEL